MGRNHDIEKDRGGGGRIRDRTGTSPVPLEPSLASDMPDIGAEREKQVELQAT
jgi:hypothetical protein